jgi:hypothetical protein
LEKTSKFEFRGIFADNHNKVLMPKKVTKLTEDELEDVVKESFKRVHDEYAVALNDENGNRTIGRNIINEMARLNKKDGPQSPFPSDKYKIWVQGDNSPHKPPHMHINYPQEGWQIKVYIENGELWSVVSYGNRGRNDTFSDVINWVKKWFEMPTTMPGRVGTNQQAALNEWDACNND